MADDATGERGAEPVRFGVVGCGAIGPTHAAAVAALPGAELVAVADPVTERAVAVAATFGVRRVYADARDLLADPGVDAVCLCLPSGRHAEVAVAAMRAGKHVLVEKPMDVTVEACDRMVAAQRATGRHLGVVSQHRFDAASVHAKRLIDGGDLGRVILATAEVKWWRTQAYYDAGDWRGTWALDGGGAVMNQGVHTVDLLRWLVGPVATVYAQARTAAHDRIEVEDAAVAALTFGNGAIGTFVATTAAYDGLPVRIDVIGTEGTVVLEGDQVERVTLKRGGPATGQAATGEAAAHAVAVARGGTAGVANDAAGRPAGAAVGSVWGDAHRAQIADFVRAIRTGTPPLIDGPAGREPVRIVRAIYESARTGRPVQLTSTAGSSPSR